MTTTFKFLSIKIMAIRKQSTRRDIRSPRNGREMRATALRYSRIAMRPIQWPVICKPRNASALLAEWNFDLIRPEFQRLMLIRDRPDLRVGVPMRVFNMHLVLGAAAGVLPRDTSKRFRKDVLDSCADKNEM